MNAKVSVEIVIVLGRAVCGERVGGHKKDQAQGQERTDDKFHAMLPVAFELDGLPAAN